MKKIILLKFFTSCFKSNAQIIASPITFNESTTFTFTIDSTCIVNLAVYHYLDRTQLRERANRWVKPVKFLLKDSVMKAGTYNIKYTPTFDLESGYYNIGMSAKNSKSGWSRATGTKVLYTGGITKPTTKNTTSIVYPNPANKNITINCVNIKKIEIFDLDGKLIKSISTSEKTISVSELNAGEYIINVYSEENKLIATEKLFKE